MEDHIREQVRQLRLRSVDAFADRPFSGNPAAPDIGALAEVPARGVIVTAAAEPGADHDFVSRIFGPNVGVPEDPVTGSAHTVLAPFWAERLGHLRMVGLQASARSGLVGVELRGDRVLLSGRAVTILDGTPTRSAGW